MASRFILLADDLRDNSVAGWERSVTLRKTANFFADRLNLNIKMAYIDDLATETKHLTPFDNRRIAAWQKRVHSAFKGAKSSLPAKAEFVIKVGPPAERIIELINSAPEPDLVIMGTRRRSALKKLFLGSVSEEVIRQSRRPVMILGPAALDFSAKERKGHRLNIIIFTDLQNNSLKAEKYGFYLAQKLEADVTLCLSIGDQVMTLRNNFYASGYVPGNIGDTIEYMYEDAALSLQKKANRFKKLGVPTEEKLLMKESPLSKIIAAEIKKGHDLVVMGTHGRSRIKTAFVGSSTRNAILHSPVPVIVVPS